MFSNDAMESFPALSLVKKVEIKKKNRGGGCNNYLLSGRRLNHFLLSCTIHISWTPNTHDL